MNDDSSPAAQQPAFATPEQASEQAFDALLSEVHGSTPPDLSAAIMARLDQHIGEQSDQANAERLGPSRRADSSHHAQSASDSGILIDVARKEKKRGSVLPIAIVAAVLAASVLLAVSIYSVVSENDEKLIADQPAPASLTPGDVQPDTPSPRVVQEQPRQPTTQRENRGVPMTPSIANIDDEPVPNQPKPIKVPVERSIATIDPIDLVATELETQWESYWNAMGIKPTSEASVDEAAARLSRVLDTPISADSMADPKRLREQVVSKALSKQIAALWLQRITDGGTKKLKQPARDDLVAEVASGIRSQQAFDKSFVRLISGQSDQASALYTAFSAGGHDALVRRLAAVSMNVDLRCTKCHDALIEGSGRQESYWSFASFIKQGLTRSRDGQWSIAADSTSKPRPMFYELPDGRQRMVDPVVDSQWMSSTLGRTGKDVREWSSGLVGSPELARGIVNSVWQLVHGRSLRGRVIDTITAPHHESLERIEERLTEDLMSSGFDVSRTIALVIASPVSRRSVPDALKIGNQLTASDEDILDALNSVDAFAASLPVQPRMNVRDRVEVAMKSAGGSLGDLDGSELLANIASGDYRSGKGKAVTLPKDSGYPYKASSLPVQWLASIDSYESQVDHLGYLAGMTELPRAIHDASVAIRKSGSSDELALRRVWWLLRP